MIYFEYLLYEPLVRWLEPSRINNIYTPYMLQIISDKRIYKKAFLLLLSIMAVIVIFYSASSAFGQYAGPLSADTSVIGCAVQYSQASYNVADLGYLSATVWAVENVLTVALGGMYCSIAEASVFIAGAAATLYVLIFAVKVLIQAEKLVAETVTKFLIIFALVILFATKAEYTLDMGYRLIMDTMQEGTSIVINSNLNAGQDCGTNPFRNIGCMYNNLFGETRTPDNDPAPPESPNEAEARLAGGLALFLVDGGEIAAGGLFASGSYLLYVFARFVKGYLIAVFIIVFIISLSPLLILCAFFRHTYSIFDRSCGYCMSSVVQIIGCFAAFIMMQGHLVSVSAIWVEEIEPHIFWMDEFTYGESGMALGFGDRTFFARDFYAFCITPIPQVDGAKCPDADIISFGKMRYTFDSPTAEQQRINDLWGKIMLYKIFLLGSTFVMSFIIHMAMEHIPELWRQISPSHYGARVGGGSSIAGLGGGDLAIPGFEEMKRARQSVLDEILSERAGDLTLRERVEDIYSRSSSAFFGGRGTP